MNQNTETIVTIGMKSGLLHSVHNLLCDVKMKEMVLQIISLRHFKEITPPFKTLDSILTRNGNFLQPNSWFLMDKIKSYIPRKVFSMHHYWNSS